MPTKKVYLNTLAQVAGKIATALISVFLIKILTNYLDLAGYGLYSKIYNYLSIFSVIADLGLYTITVREISEHKDDPAMVRKIAGTVLSIRTISGLIIILFSVSTAFFLPGYDTLPALVGILIAGIFTLTGLVNSSVLSLLQAYLKTEFSFVSTTVGKLVNLAAVIAAVYVFFPKTSIGVGFFGTYDPTLFPLFSLSAVMVAGLLGSTVMTAMLFAYSRGVEKIGFRFDPAYAKHILKSSLPYGLALFLGVAYFKADIVILSILLPHEIADSEIALYGVPMKIVEVGMTFGVIFLNSLLPLLSQAFKKKDSAELRKLSLKGHSLLSFFGIGVALFLAVSASDIVAFVANDTYLVPGAFGFSATHAMMVTSFVFLAYFLSSLYTYLLIASGEQKRLLKINGVVTVVNLIGNFAVIPFYSFFGSAVVTLLCQILLLWLTYRASRSVTDCPIFNATFLRFFGLSALSAGVSYFILSKLMDDASSFLRLALVVFVFSIFYLLPSIRVLKDSAKGPHLDDSPLPESSAT